MIIAAITVVVLILGVSAAVAVLAGKAIRYGMTGGTEETKDDIQ